MEVVWKDISGYEGWYQVSNGGEVRSIPRTINQMTRYGFYVERIMQGKVIKQTDNGKGYKIVGLRKEGERRNFYVHRLVAEAFLHKPKNREVINHKDRNTANNCVDNLEWLTQKENVMLAIPYMQHGHKAKPTATGEKHIGYRRGRYRLTIHGIIDKTFATLEEAVSAREVVLNGEKHNAV